MSVFTLLERAELEAFVAPYGLGRLLDFQGIAAGTENSISSSAWRLASMC